jgi:hypothetical protein
VKIHRGCLDKMENLEPKESQEIKEPLEGLVEMDRMV